MRDTLLTLLGAASLSLLIASPARALVGDCDEDGRGSIAEIVRGVNIALGHAPARDCLSFDADRNGTVGIDELLEGVHNTLIGRLDCRATAADCTLREASAQAGVLIGSAVRDVFDEDLRYGPTLAREFNSVTAENDMKWAATQPERGVFDFRQADKLMGFAAANRMTVRGHTLIWEQDLLDATPEYVTSIDDPDDLRALMASHIQTVVGRYRGRIDAWDVVNEPLETFGSALYENVFLELLGPGYIAEAFRLAHAADPDAVLFLNEVLLGPTGPKFDALVDLAEDLLAQGVPLHGVGLQGHFLVPPDGERLRNNLEALAALGVVVELTEVDIPVRVPGGDPAVQLEQQRRDYFDVVSACVAVEACKRVTLWGFTDSHTWIDGFIGPNRAPLPLDESYARKPAYFGLRDGLLRAPGGA